VLFLHDSSRVRFVLSSHCIVKGTPAFDHRTINIQLLRDIVRRRSRWRKSIVVQKCGLWILSHLHRTVKSVVINRAPHRGPAPQIVDTNYQMRWDLFMYPMHHSMLVIWINLSYRRCLRRVGWTKSLFHSHSMPYSAPERFRLPVLITSSFSTGIPIIDDILREDYYLKNCQKSYRNFKIRIVSIWYERSDVIENLDIVTDR